MNSHDEERLQSKANKALNDSVSGLEPSTQAQLTERRQQALTLASKPHFWLRFIQPVPIASVLAFSFALIIALPQWQSSPSNQSNSSSTLAAFEELDDLLLLTEFDDETLALLDELEFALWLSEEVELPNEDTKFEEQAANRTVRQTTKDQLLLPANGYSHA